MDMNDSSSPTYIRLHIVPFSAALLPSIIPPSILPNARNISYHTVQTFPEKPYGFVELPLMDASKLQKKLQGSILKGTKIRIESAHPTTARTLASPEPEKPQREKKKRKRDEIPGVEIERSVKRGWTESGLTKKDLKESKNKKVKSKFTNGKECLFKTVLPVNVAANEGPEEKKKKKRGDRETVVHEFEKSTKYATFLRGPAGAKKSKGVAEFVEGKGWVDEDGNVVEEAVVKPERTTVKSRKVEKIKEPTPVDPGEVISGGETNQGEVTPAAIEEAYATSTSGSSSEEDLSELSDDESEPEPASQPQDQPPIPTNEMETPRKSARPGSSNGLTISIPTSTISATQVHPHEALYKKTTDAGGNPAESSFSFFGADADNSDIEEARDTVPLTPFTQRDFEFRGMRSAAPTPDTAHANKKFLWPVEDDDEDAEARSSPAPKNEVKSKGKGKAKVKESSEEQKPEESDFTKLFYEQRGDMTRAWKKRRKVVAKEKRQRDNRKSGNRA